MVQSLARTVLRVVLLAGLALRSSSGQSPRIAASTPDTLATLDAGNRTTCLTTKSGAGWCWGELGFGRRGPFRMKDVSGRPAVLRSLSPWMWEACGLTAAEEVVCSIDITDGWRDSAGTPMATAPETCRDRDCLPPLPLRGALPPGPVRAVTTGFSHACALALNGAAFCWGENHMGQLGNGSLAADSTGSVGEITRAPTAVVGGLRFSRLDAGEQLTCGITQPDAAVYCWGYGQDGQTGDSSVMRICDGPKPYYTRPCSATTPQRVLPESLPGEMPRPAEIRFTEVSAGMRLACAIDVVGQAYCWGSNYRCALGRCRSPESPRAHRISMPGRVVEIGAGYWHACARTAENRIFCWGNNVAGQLGSLASANAGPDGLPPDYRDKNDRVAMNAAYSRDPCFLGGRCSPAPVEVAPGRRWAALAVGTDHACALAADDGGIYCWGGSDSSVFGGMAPREQCINRSPQWPDVRCQATPVRIAGLPTLAPPVVRQIGAASERQTPQARVSRRELRVIFPPDTARAWGWSERQSSSYVPRYAWGMWIDGMDGPNVFSAVVARVENEAREFPSLVSVVEAASRSDSAVHANVEGNRVVLTLRDSARIARLFGMRPPFMTVWQQRPEGGYTFNQDTVRIAYIAPEIPLPDSATRADAARSRRRYAERINTITRYIYGGPNGQSPWRPLWVVVGDSAAVYIDEMRCTYDDTRW